MGVEHASKILWTGKNIYPSELINLYEKVYQKNHKIRLDVDVLNLYYAFASEYDTYNDVMKAIVSRLFIIHFLASLPVVNAKKIYFNTRVYVSLRRKL